MKSEFYLESLYWMYYTKIECGIKLHLEVHYKKYRVSVVK